MHARSAPCLRGDARVGLQGSGILLVAPGSSASLARAASKKDSLLAPSVAATPAPSALSAARPPLTPAPKKTVKRRKAPLETTDAEGLTKTSVGLVPLTDDASGRRRSSSFDLSKKVNRDRSLQGLAEAVQAAPHEEGETETIHDGDDDGAGHAHRAPTRGEAH